METSLIENVKELCAKKGMSLKQLEEAVGFAPRYIYKWATSVPAVDKVQAVADYFGVSLDYLLGNNRPTQMSKDEVLQAAFDDRPEMRMLFSVAESASAEDIQKMVTILKMLKGD